jgi:pimeloyl-ACP methyl ester carboxylesterase
MKTTNVTGGGGVRLNVHEWGNPEGKPLLFIHGWSESHVSWLRQYESDLANEFRIVAGDNRGHGMSESPDGEAHYTQSRLWAEDVNAVITQLELDKPILVGWSYGGLIMTDYVREYGDAQIAGINFVGAATQLGGDTIGKYIGPGFTDPLQATLERDLGAAIDGIRQINDNCFVRRLPREDYERVLCWTMIPKPEVRAALLNRDVNADDILSSISVPVLITHGSKETLVLPAMAEHVAGECRNGRISWYDDCGHGPFLEDPKRFNEELREFASTTCS